MAKKEQTDKIDAAKEQINDLEAQIQHLTNQKNQLEVAFYKCIGALEVLESMKEQ